MFEGVPMAPPDAILGLNEAFQKDPNPDKINLSVGVYKDESGDTPVLACVKTAERRLVEDEPTKSYVGIAGEPVFGAAAQQLMLGPDHEIITSRRAATAQAPGGTGALRVAADTLKHLFPDATVWLSEPTWPNHPGIFHTAGLAVKTYPYYDAASLSLDFEGMVSALEEVGEGDVVVFHGCCHNPSGIDPTPEQWQALSELAGQRGFLPFFDFAYQGFGDGLDEDAAGLRIFCQPGRELLIASSFSKNFGMYRDRVGALTVVAKNMEDADKLFSNVKIAIRTNYSNPPAHGAAVVTTVLNDATLRDQWLDELKLMRDRITGMRHLFVEKLKEKGVTRDFSFLKDQRGMFSFSGLSKEQVNVLREQYSIYIVGSGRINVAGITHDNVDTLCDAVAAVL